MALQPAPDVPRPVGRERRKRLREKVHWPILVLTGRGGSAEGVTENVSSEGIFFLSEIPSHYGELLTCALKVPRYGSSATTALTVLCKARVLRTERIPDSNSFRIACRLEDYRCTAAIDLAVLSTAAAQ